MVSLADVAKVAGVSVKTVSGALNGSAARMSGETRERIITIAAQMGYVVDAAARATRQGRLPIVGLVADGLITSPFATDIMRVFDNSLKARGLSVLVSNLQRATEITAEIHALRQFRPHAIVYASMFHKIITIPQEAEKNINLTVNCHASNSTIPAIVPDDTNTTPLPCEKILLYRQLLDRFIMIAPVHWCKRILAVGLPAHSALMRFYAAMIAWPWRSIMACAAYSLIFRPILLWPVLTTRWNWHAGLIHP